MATRIRFNPISQISGPIEPLAGGDRHRRSSVRPPAESPLGCSTQSAAGTVPVTHRFASRSQVTGLPRGLVTLRPLLPGQRQHGRSVEEFLDLHQPAAKADEPSSPARYLPHAGATKIGTRELRAIGDETGHWNVANNYPFHGLIRNSSAALVQALEAIRH